jgi:hypothetical protein
VAYPHILVKRKWAISSSQDLLLTKIKHALRRVLQMEASERGVQYFRHNVWCLLLETQVDSLTSNYFPRYSRDASPRLIRRLVLICLAFEK